MNRSVFAFVAGILLATGVAQASNISDDGNVVQADAKEKQPHMRAALAALRTAKDQLDKASADKGGHRKQALDRVGQAIDAVQAGIDADNANGKDK